METNTQAFSLEPHRRTCPALAVQLTKEPSMSTARPARGLAPISLLAGALTALLMTTAQADVGGSALMTRAASLGAAPGTSTLSSIWRRHADTVLHVQLGQARIDLSLAEFDPQQQRARLFGDYYLTGPGFGSGEVDGGLRLTSGLAFGRGDGNVPLSRLGAQGALQDFVLGRDARSVAPVAQAYLGLGYSSLSLRAGWAFSADIGLGRRSAAEGLRLGQGGPSDSQVERLLDDLRLSPVIQLGVRYAF